MRKSLLFALALAGAASAVVPLVEAAPTVVTGKELPSPKRRKNKTANKINVFMGYASDRKGKGQKAREASRRRSKGWV